MKFVDPTKPYRKIRGMGHPSFCCASYRAKHNIVARPSPLARKSGLVCLLLRQFDTLCRQGLGWGSALRVTRPATCTIILGTVIPSVRAHGDASEP
jgi:hypothetical protein